MLKKASTKLPQINETLNEDDEDYGELRPDPPNLSQSEIDQIRTGRSSGKKSTKRRKSIKSARKQPTREDVLRDLDAIEEVDEQSRSANTVKTAIKGRNGTDIEDSNHAEIADKKKDQNDMS